MHADELIALWERAAMALPSARDDALLGAADEAPPRSLGARNAALLRLRARLFGYAQPLRCDCPHCAAVVEFGIDCTVLAASLAPSPGAASVQQCEEGGHRINFRVPDIDDLRDAEANSRDDVGFVQALLERCVLSCERDGRACDASELPAPVADALSRRMEALEPGARIEFDLVCSDCRAGWSATMDAGELLWCELQSRAERLLLEVDTLARAYGWSESQVLALSPVRRAAYLQCARS